MILDKNLEFADNTATAKPTGTSNIGNTVDLGMAGRFGDGSDVYLCVQVTKSFTSGGAAKVTFQVASDSTESISTNNTQSVHIASGAIGKATLVKGHQMTIPIPAGYKYERYVGVQTVVESSALTAGSINAFITIDPPADWYPGKDANN